MCGILGVGTLVSRAGFWPGRVTRRLVLGSQPVIPRMTELGQGNAFTDPGNQVAPGALESYPGAVVLDYGAIFSVVGWLLS